MKISSIITLLFLMPIFTWAQGKTIIKGRFEGIVQQKVTLLAFSENTLNESVVLATAPVIGDSFTLEVNVLQNYYIATIRVQRLGFVELFIQPEKMIEISIKNDINGIQVICKDNVVNQIANDLRSLQRTLVSNSDLIHADITDADISRKLDEMMDMNSKKIEKNAIYLSDLEKHYLEYRNSTLFQALKIYLANFDAKDLYNPRYSFVDYLSTLDEMNLQLGGGLVLKKLEALYLRAEKDINDRNAFLDFIKSNFTDKRFKNYYQLLYILESIDNKYNDFTSEDYNFYQQSYKKLQNEQAHPDQLHILKNKLSALRALEKGSPARNFTAHDAAGNPIQLADFKGKIVVVDVWATWCGPCLQEKPLFIQMIQDLQEKKEAIHFMFLSLDVTEDYDKWLKMTQKDNFPENVSHLILMQDKKEFDFHYNMAGIPRYFIIDKDGKFISANAPKPYENELKKMIEESLN